MVRVSACGEEKKKTYIYIYMYIYIYIYIYLFTGEPKQNTLVRYGRIYGRKRAFVLYLVLSGTNDQMVRVRACGEEKKKKTPIVVLVRYGWICVVDCK